MTVDRAVPRLAEWMLERVLPSHMRDALLADLAAAARDGRRPSPRSWYWRQAVAALWPPTLIALHLQARGDMPSLESHLSSTPSVAADLRFAARRMRRRPTLAIAVIALLTLGVTSSVAVFSIFSELLHPHIGVPNAEKLYAVRALDSTGNGTSYLRAAWIDAILAGPGGAKVFASSARDGVARFDGAPLTTRVGVVTPRYYELVGVRPLLGRLPAYDASGPRAEAFVSYRLWNQLFAGDPSAIGKVVSINRDSYTVVGVAPPGFDGPESGAIWIPFAIASANQPRRPALEVIARVDDKRDLPAMTSTIGPALLRAAAADAPSARPRSVALTPLAVTRDRSEAAVLRDAARVLGLLSLLVLIAACANTTNVLAMDVFERSPELAVRTALGATRGRVAQQLLAEYGWYGAIAVFVSIAASMAAMRSLPLWLPIDDEWASHLTLRANATGLVVGAVGVAVMVAVAFPLARAMRLVSSLRAVGVSTRSGPGRSVGALVAVQVAQTVVLLTAAVTLWRSEAFVRGKALGFDARSTSVFIYSLPRPQYDSAATVRFQRDVLRALAAVPGVTAGIGAPTPLVGTDQTKIMVPDGAPVEARKSAVSRGYFAAMGTRLVAGRLFDDEESLPKLIVSRSLAARLFAGGFAVGRAVRLAGDSSAYTITGVVEDGTYGGVDPVLYAFTPTARRSLYAPTIVVRSSRSRREIEAALAGAMRPLDPDVPVTFVGSLATLLDRSRLLSVMMRGLALAFCVLAVLVSSFGLYVHLARYVSARTAELGLRLALGASPTRLVRDIAAHAGRMTGAGVLVGLVASLWATTWLSSVAIGVRRADPVVLAWTISVTAVVSIVASAIPSWRAARIDPARSLSSG